MESQAAIQDHDDLYPEPIKDNVHNANVDTSRPFSSVKEAVAVFGQRLIFSGDIQSSKSIPRSRNPPGKIQSSKSIPLSPNPQIRLAGSPLSSSPFRHSLPSSPQNPSEEFMDTLKKLEAELKETKTELRKLKERESETEIAVASLNAELHKNMSKLAKAEAEAAAKSASTMTKTVSFDEGVGERERDGKKELMRRMEREYPTLAQMLGGSGVITAEKEGYLGKKQKSKMMMKKKKPIVPLVGDLFRKKGFTAHHLSASTKLC